MGVTKRGTNDNVKANRKERETGTESGRVRKKEGGTNGVFKGNEKRAETQDGKGKKEKERERERGARARSSFRGSRLD